MKCILRGRGAIILLVVSFLLPGCEHSAAIHSETTPAVTRVQHQSAQLPELIEGERTSLEHTFNITNPNTVPLAFSRIDKGCSCTTAKLAQMTVPPKGEVPLHFNVDLKGRVGAFGASASLLQENGERVNFKISALIHPVVAISPKVLHLAAR